MTAHPAETSHLSPLDLDLAALDGLPAERRRDVEAHLAGCPRCARARAQHRQALATFRATVLPRTLPAVEAALGAGGRPAGARRWWRALWLPAVAAGSLVLAWGIVREPGAIPAETPGDGIGIKSTAPSLRLVARRGEQVFPVVPGERLTAGDAVRFVVHAAGRRHVLVAAVDGRGAVSVYHPFDGAASAPVAGDGPAPLPGSVILDEAPGPERIFALFSDAPLAVEAVRPLLEALAARGEAALRSTERLPLDGVAQASALIEKEGR